MTKPWDMARVANLRKLPKPRELHRNTFGDNSLNHRSRCTCCTERYLVQSDEPSSRLGDMSCVCGFRVCCCDGNGARVPQLPVVHAEQPDEIVPPPYGVTVEGVPITYWPYVKVGDARGVVMSDGAQHIYCGMLTRSQLTQLRGYRMPRDLTGVNRKHATEEREQRERMGLNSISETGELAELQAETQAILDAAELRGAKLDGPIVDEAPVSGTAAKILADTKARCGGLGGLMPQQPPAACKWCDEHGLANRPQSCWHSFSVRNGYYDGAEKPAQLAGIPCQPPWSARLLTGIAPTKYCEKCGQATHRCVCAQQQQPYVHMQYRTMVEPYEAVREAIRNIAATCQPIPTELHVNTETYVALARAAPSFEPHPDSRCYTLNLAAGSLKVVLNNDVKGWELR